MPISKEDFKKGLDARTKKIVEFLESNSDKAFTSSEIAENLDMDPKEVIDLLNYLYLKVEAIDRMRIAETFYYSSLREED